MNFGPDTVKNVLKSSISNNGRMGESLLHTRTHAHKTVIPRSRRRKGRRQKKKSKWKESISSNEQWPSFQSQSRLRRASVWMHEKLLNKSWYINHLTIEPIQSWFYDNDDDDDDADVPNHYTHLPYAFLSSSSQAHTHALKLTLQRFPFDSW